MFDLGSSYQPLKLKLSFRNCINPDRDLIMTIPPPRRTLAPSSRKLTPGNSIHCQQMAGLYDLEETLGKGHFATVKSARHVFTGEKVNWILVSLNFNLWSCAF